MEEKEVISTEEVEVKERQNEEEKKRKKKRNTIVGNILFLLINAVIVTVLVVIEDRSGEKVSGAEAMALFGQNWYWTVLAFLMFFVMCFADTAVFSLLIKKTGKKDNLALSLEVSFLGRYYDRITPWSIGGEPFQIATLMSGGLSAGDSSSVTMSRHIVRFFSTAVVVIGILVGSRITTNIYVMVVAILSILGGLVIPSFMLLCAFKPSIGLKIGEGAIKLLHKMKIIKNYEKQMEKMKEEVNKFLGGIKYLSTNKIAILLIAVAAIVELFATNSIPYFVMKGLGNAAVTYWHTLVLCIFVNYSSSFAPTPGGAGIAELSFYAIFAAYVADGYLFWAVLFWRIAIFFMPVFLGFFIQTYKNIKNIVLAKKK